MNTKRMISRSPLSLLALLGLTLFASPVAAQVFSLGPSPFALFDNVVNVPTDPNIGFNQNIGGDGLTTQLNIYDGGSIDFQFTANSGGEVNVIGGFLGGGFTANFGSELNISGGNRGNGIEANSGSVINISGGNGGNGITAFSGSEVNISGGNAGTGFDAFAGSVVNISGGIIGDDFDAHSGSLVNLFGSDFFLDGELLDDDLSIGSAFTILDRNVELSGRLADGTPVSFDLNSNYDVDEFFSSDATLTVTLVSSVPEPSSLAILGLGAVMLWSRRRKTL